MPKIKINTAQKVVPMIYAYTTPEIQRHNGWTKIGYTEQGVDKRLNQQTHTADVLYLSLIHISPTHARPRTCSLSACSFGPCLPLTNFPFTSHKNLPIFMQNHTGTRNGKKGTSIFLRLFPYTYPITLSLIHI